MPFCIQSENKARIRRQCFSTARVSNAVIALKANRYQGLSSTSSMVGMTARRAGKPIVPMPGVTSRVPAGVL